MMLRSVRCAWIRSHRLAKKGLLLVRQLSILQNGNEACGSPTFKKKSSTSSCREKVDESRMKLVEFIRNL